MLLRLPSRARRLAPALLVATALAAVPALAQPVHQDGHAAHAAHAAHANTVPAAAQRWATDAPLRAGMRQLREAAMLLEHYEMGHLDDTQRDNAVASIDAAVSNMVANCKLKPDADAALHGLLVKFIGAANAARAGKLAKTDVQAMTGALAQYPALFIDPDWGRDTD